MSQRLFVTFSLAVLLCLCFRLLTAFRCNTRADTIISNVSRTGVLKSPNFGQQAGYPRGACFVYSLLAGQDQLVLLRLRHFHVGSPPSAANKGCDSDFVDFYVESFYLRRLCGNLSGGQLRGISNVTFVLYSARGDSPGASHRQGFRIAYEFQYRVGCGVTKFRSSDQLSGWLSSPGYSSGDGYSPLTDCVYELIGTDDQRVVIDFSDLHLAPSTLCHADYLAIINVFQQRWTLALEHLCGEVRPGRVISDSGRVRIRFHSSAIRWETFRGFRLSYRFIYASELAKAENEAAGDNADCGQDSFTGWHGVIRSPRIPQAGLFSPVAGIGGRGDIRCAWLILVPHGWQVALSVSRMWLGEESAGSNAAHLSIYDGFPQALQPPLERICGEQRADRELEARERLVMSSGSVLFIRFFARRETLDSRMKFTLKYTAALKAFTGSDKCPGFLCKGAAQCRDSSQLSCVSMPSYCLHNSARCNGVRSCSEAELTDEQGCISSQTVAGLTAGLLFSAVVVAVTAALSYATYRSRLQVAAVASASTSATPASGSRRRQTVRIASSDVTSNGTGVGSSSAGSVPMLAAPVGNGCGNGRSGVVGSNIRPILKLSKSRSRPASHLDYVPLSVLGSRRTDRLSPVHSKLPSLPSESEFGTQL